MTLTVDKLRKGIDLHGMSPDEDLVTGALIIFHKIEWIKITK